MNNAYQIIAIGGAHDGDTIATVNADYYHAEAWAEAIAATLKDRFNLDNLAIIAPDGNFLDY